MPTCLDPSIGIQLERENPSWLKLAGESRNQTTMQLFPSFPSTRLGTTLLLGTLLTTGCANYQQPKVDAPHASILGTYLGGEKNETTGYYAFGYIPAVKICKGRQTDSKCGKFAAGKLDGRQFPFRVKVGKEITVIPMGLIDSKYYNDGVSSGTTRTYCVGKPHTFTPSDGQKLEYVYDYQKDKGCGSIWKE